MVLPGPEAARRYWGSADYLQASVDRDREIRRLISQLPDVTLVGVPLIAIDQYERWCGELDIETTDPQSRARWCATQMVDRTHDDHGLPVVRGVHPLGEAGDALAISLALATGWDGVTPMAYWAAPPEHGWSRISVEVLSEPVIVALHMVRPACQVAWLHLTGGRPARSGIMDGMDRPGKAPGEGWRRYQCRNVVLWRR